ncbi:MAG: alpha/beta hydrolase [Gammaproteobacteria bacterium]|nr:alpha/beta hydrolase [Gammaproteobacteria bacterium]
MALHPQAQAFLDQAAGAPPMHTLPLAAARAAFDAMAALGGPPEAVASVQDRLIPGPAGPLPSRVYRPSTRDGLPVALWFHAGGFTVGSLASHDPLCRALANRSGCAVVALDYRLAPEHPFPAALDDAWAAVQWIAGHGAELGLDTARMAVCGDSVGGGLATITSLLARDAGGPALRLQVLVYPDLDWRFTSPSWTTMSRDYFVTREVAEWLRHNYLPDPAQWTDWRASPTLAPSHVNLPPALMICPEFTPIRSDVEAYVERLRQAGVAVDYWLAAGMVMGFVTMAGVIDAGRQALDRIGAALSAALEA